MLLPDKRCHSARFSRGLSFFSIAFHSRRRRRWKSLLDNKGPIISNSSSTFFLQLVRDRNTQLARNYLFRPPFISRGNKPIQSQTEIVNDIQHHASIGRHSSYPPGDHVGWSLLWHGHDLYRDGAHASLARTQRRNPGGLCICASSHPPVDRMASSAHHFHVDVKQLTDTCNYGKMMTGDRLEERVLVDTASFPKRPLRCFTHGGYR